MRDYFAIAFGFALFALGSVWGASGEEPPSFVISTIAGTGKLGYSGDGKKAIKAKLRLPTAVAIDSKGNVFIADDMNQRIRKVTPKGIITTVVGTGQRKPETPDGPPLEMNLHQAYGVAVDSQDNLYVLNRGYGRVYKITPGGALKTIIGTGERGYNGDGIPATEAMVDWPDHLVVDDSGIIYLADTWNNRIRKVTADGIIHTIAGNGVKGSTGDGGPAVDAQIRSPAAIALGPDGSLYFAEFSGHRIRKISTDGIITTVAGTGTAGYNGEGIIATEAQLGEPCGVAVDRDGLVYIGEQLNHRIRVVTKSGHIYTVAGTGEPGFSGAGGPATAARLWNPDIIAFDKEDNLYFPDNRNSVIRKLTRSVN